MAATATTIPSLQLTPKLHKSYLESSTYPCNTIVKHDYRDDLESQRRRLDLLAGDLLTDTLNPTHAPRADHEPAILVSFRDWDESSKAFVRCKVEDRDGLRSWLGDRTPSAATTLVDLTKADPRCRFVFLYGETSRSRLKISREMMCQLFTHHQVMPQYLRFISVFGVKTAPNDITQATRDLRFGGFQVQNAACRTMATIPDLGRSGKCFQMCYNLKTVVEKSSDDWSIRQTAIHHQFDFGTGNALWINTMGGLSDIKKRVEALTGSSGQPEDRSFNDVFECFRSSLAIHLMYCHRSTEGWQWYIEYLERRIEQESFKAVVAPQSAASGAKMYSSRTLQILQHDMDRTNETIMVIESNLEIIRRLRDFYCSLVVNRNFISALPATQSAGQAIGQTNQLQTVDQRVTEEVTVFVMQLESMASDMGMHVSRAKLLVTVARDRNTLILQHMQSQSTEKMHTLTLLSHKEAIVMRIITIVTLIFLPATFVSTFFSTDVVKYQNADSNTAFSSVALQRWLQVTIPLTFLTVGFGLIAFRYAKVKSERELLPYHNEKMV